MKNIYTDHLEAFSFVEMLADLNAIGIETQRLEFKREISARKLAHKVCSFANASGGIIVIGVEQPNVGEDLRFAETPTDISDKKQLSYTSSINAWVYPQPPFEMHPYRDEDTGRTLLAVRIGSSTIGPHEYLGAEESTNLPIRRGTETKPLSLTDIEALQRRRDGSVSESPLKNLPGGAAGRVFLQQSGHGGDFYFGVHVTPVTYGPRRIMDPDDDSMCLDIEKRTRASHEIVHRAMSHFESTAYSLWMHSGDAPGQNIQPNIPSSQLEIVEDGQILIRLAQRDRDVLDQYINSFLTAYAVAQEVFYHFRLAPAARFHIVAHLNSVATTEKAPQFHEDYLNVDLARDSFADAFTDTVMVIMRSGGQAQRRDEVHSMLGRHEPKLPFLSKQLERWLSGSD